MTPKDRKDQHAAEVRRLDREIAAGELALSQLRHARKEAGRRLDRAEAALAREQVNARAKLQRNPEQQCNNELRAAGLPMPRTCALCGGFGPCHKWSSGGGHRP